ncbi:hypothetical protein CARUB_v10022400mg, partial [Capsella rubella]
LGALVLPLLLILFTLSSQVEVVESRDRKLAFWEKPIVWTPPSNSCGAFPAAIESSKWTTGRPCRHSRPPGTNISNSLILQVCVSFGRVTIESPNANRSI